jgi:hypothetical protein
LILLGTLTAFAQRKSAEPANALPLVGAYDVTFSLDATTTQTRRLTFLLYTGGTGIFRLEGIRTWTPSANAAMPSVYDWITPDRISFSGEMRFPIGNVGQETGTLVFKGQRTSNGAIIGRAIFVTNVPDATNPTGFVTRSGPFTATPLPIVAAK